jgi:hypothetical protein
MHDTGSDSGDGISGARQEHAQIITRPATLEDLIVFYGERPSGTTRAIVAEMDGEIVGVIGIIRERLWGKYFSEFSPALQPHLKSITIMRAIKESLKFCDNYRGPVLAVANDAESCRIMNRLGFTHLHGAWYGWLK